MRGPLESLIVLLSKSVLKALPHRFCRAALQLPICEFQEIPYTNLKKNSETSH